MNMPAHSPQNFVFGGFSCWHRRHCMPEPPSASKPGTVGQGGASLVWRAGGVNPVPWGWIPKAEAED
jgi:hypothetical protein